MGPPKRCCHIHYSDPIDIDECRCGCGLYNGMFQVVGSQLFLFMGFLFSAAAIADCDLVGIEEEILVREDGVTATNVGMVSYQDSAGRCYYWTNTISFSNGSFLSGDDQVEYYVTQVLGATWYVVYVLCATACAASFVVFLYSLSYCCSTQVRAARALWAFITIVIGAIQGIGISWIYNSPWCDDLEGGCTIGRSTIWGIVACGCFWLSGICFLCMRDYPGKEYFRQMKAAELATAREQAEVTPDKNAEVMATSEEQVDDEIEEEEEEESIIEEVLNDVAIEEGVVDSEDGVEVIKTRSGDDDVEKEEEVLEEDVLEDEIKNSNEETDGDSNKEVPSDAPGYVSHYSTTSVESADETGFLQALPS